MGFESIYKSALCLALEKKPVDEALVTLLLECGARTDVLWEPLGKGTQYLKLKESSVNMWHRFLANCKSARLRAKSLDLQPSNFLGFFLACEAGDVDEVDRLLKGGGFDPDQYVSATLPCWTELFGQENYRDTTVTAVGVAAAAENVRLLRLLLRHGVDFEFPLRLTMGKLKDF
jgi:hypothetical protein